MADPANTLDVLPAVSRVTSPASLTAATSQLPTTPSVDLDLTSLTSPEFVSESDWLNGLLGSSLTASRGAQPSLGDIESTLTRTLHSLDLSVSDTSAQVDRLITDISLSVPRLTFDLQLMRENALLLRFTLDSIRNRGGGFGTQSEVGQVLERMKLLDLVKQRMEAARDVLREAESWSTLESEVTGLVGEEQFQKAAERLAEAARSMVVFQNTAEYEARRALMVSLQNQLETSLSSGLVKAINERDVKGCTQFWKTFGMIQREQEYRSYYFSSRRGGLVDSWTTAKLIDCLEVPSSLPTTTTLPSSQPPQKFTTFLSHFYSDLHALLTEERTYIPAIFPDPLPTLSSFIQTTLEGLSPTLPQRLTSIADTYGPTVLPELILALKATEEFAVQAERIFAKLEPPSPPAPTPTAAITNGSNNSASPRPTHSPSSPSLSGPPPTPSRCRLSTKRRSLSQRLSSRSLSFASGATPDFVGAGAVSEHSGGEGIDGEISAHVRERETALFEPFLDWQVEYPELERRFLVSEMGRTMGDAADWVLPLISSSSSSTSLGINPASSGAAGSKLLLEKTAKLFGLLEDAVGRNLALTHGYAAKGLVEVINDVLVGFFESRRDDLVRASREKGSAAERRRAQVTAAQLAGGLGMGGADEEQEMVLEGLEYSTEDWTTFQFGLKVLDACRGMGERLSGFEGRLKGRMTVLAQAVAQARNEPGRYTAPGTTRGAVLLLRQSTLNSADLAELLDPLERPEAPTPSQGTLAHSHPPPPPPVTPFLLPKARGAAVEFTRTTQLFLHDTILAPLLNHLNEYSSLSCWTTSIDRPGGKGAFDLSIPTFSLSPTETISRVGEGLFNLPRLFEVYADDDALSFSIETLPYVDVEAIRAMQQPPTTAQAMGRSHSGHRTTPSFDTFTPSSPPLSRSHRGSSFSSSSSALPPPPVQTIPLSAETVIATWLSSLTLSILTHLTTQTLPSLTRLSKHGAVQLSADLDYIVNVARALEVESPRGLDRWREAVEVAGGEEGTWREGRKEVDAGGVGAEVWDRVGKLRGFGRRGQ
ncbi:hypothetical protein JCM11641_005490 [Rhodosporidiobolus odoratus]